MEKEERRSFSVGYRDGLFDAHVPNDNGTWSKAEVAYGLEELFEKCRGRGLNYLYSLTGDAIDKIYEWMVKVKPVLDFVENHWEGESSASRRIGFRLPEQRD